MGLNGQWWEHSTYGDKKFHSTRISFAFESKSTEWTMENMLQHTTCHSFGTDCKKLIAMIKEPHAWRRYKYASLPRARNQISDFLAKTARSFHKELHFIACSVPV
ncbi:hypothetical protein F2Q69_00053002 [Brassica cretica]|uniref:RNase H type-1 domain-containing protein n=1 Tax=Brassica cretica TaxID=69181 RepID=A0A8S9N6Y6_BRACR|nr:hypothetical protein F2Q69_00053002 [Brassica cretica]